MKRRLLLTAGLLFATGGLTAWAQTAPPMRIRGTVASMTGNVLSVKSRDGKMLDIVVPDALAVGSVKKVELSDVPVGAFIGTATRTGADGKNVAIEVLVF